MKTKIKIIMCFWVGVFTASCSDGFLDQTKTTDLDERTVFSDSAYTAGFLTQIYVDIGFDTDLNRFGNGGLQVACDEAEFKQSSSISTGMQFATGTVNPVTVTNDVWDKCYTNIRRCNKFLHKVGNSPMAESTKNQYRAEARFLRAWYYFILLRHYGGVPLIGDTIFTANDAMNNVRNTYAQCVDYILSETDAVIKAGVLRPRTTGRSNGRISEGVCRALKSRLLLYAASPLHNGSGFGTEQTKDLLGYPTHDDGRWLTAMKAARDVMTMNADWQIFHVDYDDEGKKDEPGWGFYAVMFPADFTDVTSYKDEKYSYGAYQEIIFEKKGKEGLDVCQQLDPVSCGGNGSGGYIYKELADAFPMVDGLPIGESQYTFDPLHPNVNRDPRFANTVIYNGSTVMSAGDASHVVYTRTGDNVTQDEVHNGTLTGFFIRKLLNRATAANYFVAPPMSRPLIRYAEILLNYAEAANEYYGPEFNEQLGGQDIGPLQVLKIIRERAGIEPGADNMYGLKYGMNKEEMRQAIRNERQIELAFEGFRFFDVRRWMIAEETENKSFHILEISVKNNVETSKEFIVRTHVFRKGMYFFPLPYSEIAKRPGLIQNPYYE